jgi:hypothetical protein
MYVELLKAKTIPMNMKRFKYSVCGNVESHVVALKKAALLRSALVKPIQYMVFSVILPCSLVHDDSYFGENCTHPIPSKCRYPRTRLHGIATHTTTIYAIKAVKITGLINIPDLHNKGTNESTLV